MKRRSPEWWAVQRPEVVGKETERMVVEVLDEYNKSQHFAYHRLPDAKSARGALAAQPADFIVSPGRGMYLEVKAIKHAFRLPKDKVRQLPTLKKFEMAGMPGVIVVHHYIEGVWRVLRPKYLDFGVPSWDISYAYGYRSVQEALNEALYGEEK